MVRLWSKLVIDWNTLQTKLKLVQVKKVFITTYKFTQGDIRFIRFLFNYLIFFSCIASHGNNTFIRQHMLGSIIKSHDGNNMFIRQHMWRLTIKSNYVWYTCTHWRINGPRSWGSTPFLIQNHHWSHRICERSNQIHKMSEQICKISNQIHKKSRQNHKKLNQIHKISKEMDKISKQMQKSNQQSKL